MNHGQRGIVSSGRMVAAVVVVLLAVPVAGNAAPPGAATRTVAFAGGEAVVTRTGAVEHVVIHDPAGHVLASSDCSGDTGTYDEGVRFFGELKARVAAGDPSTVAALVDYPLRVNHGPGRADEIASRSAFIADYARIVTPAVAARIAKLDPHVVFCRDDMAMGGAGVVWVGRDHAGNLKLKVVNQ